jgi:hypothetical protein
MIAELRDTDARLKVVVAYLKAKHTQRSVDESIAHSETFLNDHTPAFITIDGSSFEGTRHVGSLMKLCDALEVKVGLVGLGADLLTEFTSLLEKKVRLLRDVYGV